MIHLQCCFKLFFMPIFHVFSVMIYVRFTDILKHLILSVFTRTVGRNNTNDATTRFHRRKTILLLKSLKYIAKDKTLSFCQYFHVGSFNKDPNDFIKGKECSSTPAITTWVKLTWTRAFGLNPVFSGLRQVNHSVLLSVVESFLTTVNIIIVVAHLTLKNWRNQSSPVKKNIHRVPPVGTSLPLIFQDRKPLPCLFSLKFVVTVTGFRRFYL